jgi:hypothetical protein
MKTNLALLSLLVIPSFAFAADVPDGLLGTNTVAGYGVYENREINGVDSDFAGAGIALNQNIYNGSQYGFDVGGNFYYETNQTGAAEEKDQYRDFEINLTTYRKGIISPFFSVLANYLLVKEDITTLAVDGNNVSHVIHTSIHDDSTLIGFRAGVECHLLPGWYVTPFVAYSTNIDATDSASDTYVAIRTGYWFATHFGVFTEVGYEKVEHKDCTSVSAGVTIHY